MRRVHGIDANHREIVKALRAAGASVQDLAGVGNGCPDLLAGFRGRNYLLEVKPGNVAPSRSQLNDAERIWHLCWRGDVVVVRSVEEALRVIGLAPVARAAGEP